MEVDGSGDDESAVPGRGKKRPPSPATPPSDGEEDDDVSWVVSEEEEEEEDEDDQEGMHRPFTVDDFPRLSSDHSVQTNARYQIPDLCLRGPLPLILFCAFNDPLTDKRRHWFGSYYRLDDESERYGVFIIDHPARGICITSHVLFELQLCVRTEDSTEAEDEPKGDTLIEGCTELTNILRSESFIETVRLYGEKCGLDVKFVLLGNAVQAIVDVEIVNSPVCGLNLKLYAKTSGFSDVIRLFQGVALCGRRVSSVVAVVRRSHLDLCIEGSPTDIGLGEKLPCVRWEHRVCAGFHGTVDDVMKLGDFTTISVKVTWKAVDKRPSPKG